MRRDQTQCLHRFNARRHPEMKRLFHRKERSRTRVCWGMRWVTLAPVRRRLPVGSVRIDVLARPLDLGVAGPTDTKAGAHVVRPSLRDLLALQGSSQNVQTPQRLE